MTSNNYREFQDWLKTPRGQDFAGIQKDMLLEALGNQGSGYHFMVLGSDPIALATDSEEECDLLKHSHVFTLGESPGDRGQAIAEFSELPLPSDTIDKALIYHVLEYHHSPHSVLKEVSRVVAPGGLMLIVVMNPLSLYGLYGVLMSAVGKAAFWQRRALRKGRLIDWLKLLNFQTVSVRSGGYFFPPRWRKSAKEQRWLNQWMESLNLPFGAFNVIAAKKVVRRPIDQGHFPWRALPVGKNLPVGENKLAGNGARSNQARTAAGRCARGEQHGAVTHEKG
ncbi:MAG: class I SAM-dependent methyltransferase [bacterium]